MIFFPHLPNINLKFSKYAIWFLQWHDISLFDEIADYLFPSFGTSFSDTWHPWQVHSQGELFPTLVSSVSNHHNPSPLPAISFSSYLVSSFENRVGYSPAGRELIRLHRSPSIWGMVRSDPSFKLTPSKKRDREIASSATSFSSQSRDCLSSLHQKVSF